MLACWFASFLAAYLASDIYYQTYIEGTASAPYAKIKDIWDEARKCSVSPFKDFPTFFTTSDSPLHLSLIHI